MTDKRDKKETYHTGPQLGRKTKMGTNYSETYTFRNGEQKCQDRKLKKHGEIKSGE
jgi:hypothetical protein